MVNKKHSSVRTRGALISVCLLVAILCSGCIHSPYVKTYRAAYISQVTVSEAHRVLWSEPLRERKAACDASIPPVPGSLSDFISCMGPFTVRANASVVKSLAAYNVVAEELSSLLLAHEGSPEKLSSAELKLAAVRTIAAARKLLALFPAGARWSKRIDALM